MDSSGLFPFLSLIFWWPEKNWLIFISSNFSTKFFYFLHRTSPDRISRLHAQCHEMQLYIAVAEMKHWVLQNLEVYRTWILLLLGRRVLVSPLVLWTDQELFPTEGRIIGGGKVTLTYFYLLLPTVCPKGKFSTPVVFHLFFFVSVSPEIIYFQLCTPKSCWCIIQVIHIL
jgi:hypothetical protein